MDALRHRTNVTLVGGAPFGGALIAQAMCFAPVLIAADGGANRLEKLNLMPQTIIGDLDSLRNRQLWRARLGKGFVDIPDQGRSDFEKCLALIEAPLILAIGFVGARADHFLAALSAMRRNAARRVILLGGRDILFLAPGRIGLDLGKGCRISILPLEAVRVVHSSGLRWPIGGMRLETGYRTSLSNRSMSERVEMAFTRPHSACIILPRRKLPAAIAAL